MKIACSLVNAIRGQTPPGRFLKLDAESGVWDDIGDKRAIEKTSQALREGQGIIKQNVLGRDNVEHSETERTSTTGASTTSSTSHSHQANPNNLSSMDGEKIDNSTLSEDSSDEEELNYLIYQTFSKDENYWSKSNHIPKLPSMNQMSIWNAVTSSQEEGHDLDQSHSEKRKYENLEMVTSYNDNTKHRRTEYSNMLPQNPNFSSKAIISDTKRDEIISNHNFLFKSVTGNGSSHHTIQNIQDGATTLTHTQIPHNPIWHGSRSA